MNIVTPALISLLFSIIDACVFWVVISMPQETNAMHSWLFVPLCVAMIACGGPIVWSALKVFEIISKEVLQRPRRFWNTTKIVAKRAFSRQERHLWHAPFVWTISTTSLAAAALATQQRSIWAQTHWLPLYAAPPIVFIACCTVTQWGMAFESFFENAAANAPPEEMEKTNDLV